MPLLSYCESLGLDCNICPLMDIKMGVYVAKPCWGMSVLCAVFAGIHSLVCLYANLLSCICMCVLSTLAMLTGLWPLSQHDLVDGPTNIVSHLVRNPCDRIELPFWHLQEKNPLKSPWVQWLLCWDIACNDLDGWESAKACSSCRQISIDSRDVAALMSCNLHDRPLNPYLKTNHIFHIFFNYTTDIYQWLLY